MSAMRMFRSGPMAGQWVILGLALVVLGVVVGGNLYQEHVNVEAREKERLLHQTRIVQQSIDLNLRSLNTVLGDLAKDWSQGNTSRDINHRLATLNEALTGVRTLILLDEKGKALASNRPEIVGLSLGHREYFKAARDNPEPDTLYVSPPFRSVLGVVTINVTRTIHGPDGEFAGAVSAGLDPAFFIPLLGSVLYAPDMRANIIHDDGQFFLSVPANEGMVGMNLDRPGSFFRKHRESGSQACVMTGKSYAAGEERMVAASTITPTGAKTDKAIVLFIGRDPAMVFEPWRRQAYLHVGLFAAFAALCCLGLYGRQRMQHAYESQKAQAAKALAENQRFMQMVTDNIPGLVAYWGADLRCVYANHAYLDWFGKSPEKMRGISLREMMGEALYSQNEPYIRAALGGQAQQFERTLVKADGSTKHTLARYIPDIRDGQVMGFFVLVSDVSELKATQLELERRVRELDTLAATDPLTGIGNRRFFLNRAREETERSSRYGQPLVFLMLDIDHFKHINDSHGHDVGDKALLAVASTLRHAVRATDLIGRLGGEEFGALLVQTDMNAALHIAHRLRDALRHTVVEGGGVQVRLSASIGLAVYEGGGDTVDMLMKRADLALYSAKEAGRDRVCVFGED